MGDNASSSEQEGNTLLLYCTILGFAAVSWLLWKFLFSPAPQRTASAAAGSGTAAASTRSGTDAASTTVAARRSATGTTSSSAARRSSGATAAAASSSSSSLHSSKGGADDDDAFSFGRPRHPPHFIPPRGWETNKYDASTCLLQGIVPFRSGPAAGYETRLQNRWNAKAATTTTAAAAATNNDDDDDTAPKADLIVINRRERARIFARMFSASSAAGGGGGGGRPPNRGANIVVTIRHSDVSCSKLQKALFLLGTYYNLFLLIDGSSSGFSASGGGGAASSSSSSTEIGGNEKETREFIDKLRSELLNRNTNRATNNNNNNNDDEEEEGDGDSKDTPEYKLNPRILPPHRIAFSSTPKGRVAFVRQLHGTELVVDCDAGVTKELERFGFRVVLVVPPPENNKGDGDKGDVVSSSALGKFLIP